MEKYHKIHIWDFPISKEIYVNLNKDFSCKLIINAVNLLGNRETLKNCLRSRFGNSPSKSTISQWKSGTRIRLDYLLEIANLIKYPLDLLEKKITLCSKNFRIKSINFPLDYDENLAFIGECIRTEGSLSKGTKVISFSNRDVSFLREFKRRLAKLGIRKLHESLHIYVNIPSYFRKKDIKIFNKTPGSEIKNFNLKTNKKDKRFYHEKTNRLVFVDCNFKYGMKQLYEISLKNKKDTINVEIPNNSRIKIISKYKTSAVIHFQISNIILRWVLKYILAIPEGKKDNDIIIPDILKDSSKPVIASAINAVLAAEGYLTYVKPPKSIRTIGIEMNSQYYLKDLKELFERFEIKSSLSYRKKKAISILRIYGKENLLKISKDIKFIQPNKNQRFLEMLRYREFLGEESEILTLNAIKKLGGTGKIADLAKLVGRKERTLKRYLGILKRKNKIYLSNTRPQMYILKSDI